MMKPAMARASCSQARLRLQRYWKARSRRIGAGVVRAEKSRNRFGYRTDFEQAIEVLSGLGAGSYGTVRRGYWKDTGHEVAIKSIPKRRKGLRGSGLSRYQARVRREVDTHLRMGKSLDVVHLEDVFEDHFHVHLILELCLGGQLFSRKDIASGVFSEATAASVMRSVLRGIAQCHAKNVAFRDIKPENFMYVSTEEGAPLKLSDFGMATFFNPGEPLTERCGTVYYTAPEVIKQNYGLEADVWSAGVLAYQLLSGQLPFVDEEEEEGDGRTRGIWRSILYSQPDVESDPWDHFSDEAKNFVWCLLTKDPEQRPSAAKALKHEWLQKEGTQGTEAPIQVVSRLQRFATQGALKQTIFRAVASDLDGSLEELGVLRELFNRLDQDSRGGVSMSELQDGLAREGFTLNDEEAKQLFEGIDVDHSGLITFDEFSAALLDWRKLEKDQHWHEWAERAFHDMKSKAGASEAEDEVTAEGLADVVCDVAWEDGSAVCRESVRDVLGDADLDSDGKIGLEEWLWLVHSDEGDDETIYESRFRPWQ